MSEKICGIYKITNKINGKVYIGQSQDICKRWHEHKNNIKRERYSHVLLYKAFIKYGIDNFIFEIVEKCEENSLSEREIYYIDKFRSYVGFDDSNGYNMTLGGEGIRGAERTIEWRLHLSEGHKGISTWNKGKKYSLPHMKGKFAGKNNPFFGRHHTEETRRKLSECAKGRVNGVTRQVICEGMVYNSIKECADHYSIDSRIMSDWLRGRRGMPLFFFEKGLKFIDSDIKTHVACPASGKRNGSSRMVQCINTGEIFDTMKQACEKYKVNINSMVSVCKGRRKSAGKLPCGEKLHWQYYQEDNERR